MEQLDPHWTKYWPPMEEEKVSSGSGMFDGVLNDVDDRVALELCEATETKVTCKKKFPN